MQIVVSFLVFYVFGLAAIIMTFFVVRTIMAYLRPKKKEETQNATDRVIRQN